jgi:polyphosphate kinase
VAPIDLSERVEKLIEREIEHQREGRQGPHHPEDERAGRPRIIRLLYGASQAGVKIDLIVRGMCCLRSGHPGVSETIRVVSIVGRFLEHSRVFWFGTAATRRSSSEAPTSCRGI